mmetsp:Transcript_93607/g.297018  ORF Transcript_93607/g.297018 Transcript_93607/m.297018 type:complete len:250 (+) Transcript_93607:1076-1825(+)
MTSAKLRSGALLGMQTSSLACAWKFRRMKVSTQKFSEEAAICRNVRPARLTFWNSAGGEATATRLKRCASWVPKVLLWQSRWSSVSPRLRWISATSTPRSVPGGKASSIRFARPMWLKATACHSTEWPEASRIFALQRPLSIMASTVSRSPTWTACHNSAEPADALCSERSTPLPATPASCPARAAQGPALPGTVCSSGSSASESTAATAVDAAVAEASAAAAAAAVAAPAVVAPTSASGLAAGRWPCR